MSHTGRSPYSFDYQNSVISGMPAENGRINEMFRTAKAKWMLLFKAGNLTSSLSDLSFLRPPEHGTSGIMTAVGVNERGIIWGTMNPHGEIIF